MRRTRDELVEEFHEDAVEYWEGRIGEGETGRPYGFGRDATLWELLYLDARWIHVEFRHAYERATRDGACPIRELHDWIRESAGGLLTPSGAIIFHSYVLAHILYAYPW